MLLVIFKTVFDVSQLRYKWKARANLLRFAFVGALVLVVDAGEVGDDDGHRKRDDEHAAEGADAAHYLPHLRARHYVAVPETRTSGSAG